jgi:hypothetical protein
MAGALLRSGSLREFHPLGAVGRPVYSAATQLRAAMRRQLGDDVADLFAIPKANDRGDQIDWYAPRQGGVVPWSSATPEERSEAKAALLAARADLDARSRDLQREESSERQVFGKLLAEATQIPSEDHIYLVEGRPVITFWGFHPLDPPPGLDVIGSLDAGPPAVARVEPLPIPASPNPVVDPARPWWRRWWLLFLLLLLPLLLWLLWLRACSEELPLPLPEGLREERGEAEPIPPEVPEEDPDVVRDRSGAIVEGDPSAASAAEESGGVEEAGIPPDGEAEVGEATPPDDQTDEELPATDPTEESSPGEEEAGAEEEVDAGASEPPPNPDQLADPEQEDEVPEDAAMAPQEPLAQTPPTDPGDAPQPPAQQPLAIPEQALTEGSTEFLNGSWNTGGLDDSKGNRIQMSYDFKDGSGRVKVKRKRGDVQDECQGEAQSAIEGGQLVIHQRDVRCPDGSSIQDVRVECDREADGRAVCEGRNSDGSVFDAEFTR